MSKYWGSSGGSYRSYWWDYWSSEKKETKKEEKEEEEYDWRTAYKSRYKSSLGYSSSKLSESIGYGSSWYGGYSYTTRTADDTEKARVLIEKTYKAARDLVIILDLPFKVSVQMTPSGEEMEFGDYRRIFLPTKVLDDSTYTEADKIYLNPDSSYMFYRLDGLIYPDLSNWNTSSVTNMSSMFSSCSSLT
jgi:surface protein